MLVEFLLLREESSQHSLSVTMQLLPLLLKTLIHKTIKFYPSPVQFKLIYHLFLSEKKNFFLPTAVLRLIPSRPVVLEPLPEPRLLATPFYTANIRGRLEEH